MRYGVFLVVAVMVCVIAAPVQAAVPQLINYQSVITDNVGDPVPNGTYAVSFSIYDDEFAGNLLWTEANNSVQVTDSRFNVLLGSIEPLNDSVFSGTNRWLEVEFVNEVLEPRIRLVSVGYAHRIATIDGASGGEVSGEVLIEATSNGNAFEVRQHTAGARAGRFENTSLSGTEAALLGISNGSGAGVAGFNPWGGPGLSSGGGFIVTDDNLNTKFEVNPYGNQGGGDVYLYQSNGDMTVEMLATETANEFGQINFYKNAIRTLSLSGGNSSQGSDITLFNDAGTATIFIDAENSSNGGRIAVYDGADATLGGAVGGFLQLGMNSGVNLLLDNDEILARNNGQTTTLNLQADGGAVGIGTNGLSIPSGYILGVDGKAIMEEVEVQLSADWPDYVFEEGYDMLSLDELASHVAEKKHLPGIPSAADMDGQRLPLGEMQTKLLEKVEELTVYLLQVKSELDAATAANAELQSRVAELEADVQ